MYKLDRLLVTGGALSNSLFASVVDSTVRGIPNIAAGSRLGNYRILEEIGSGGTSVVYRAERADGAFEQLVAIKVSYTTPELRLRGRQERDMLGRLRHPKIAQILDGGETPDGDVWFAMELVSGIHIDDYCEQHDFGWQQRIQLLSDVCDAVHHAHQCLVLHRDIKPNNILVDESGNLKLLDFGISSLFEDASAKRAFAALTPEYASPEQFANAVITTASDIYQVGRVMEDLLDAALAIPRLAARNLAAIVAKATRPNAEMRYSSIAAMKEDLKRALRCEPARARPWTAGRRLQFFVTRNAKACTAALALLILSGSLTAHFAARAIEGNRKAQISAFHATQTATFLREIIFDLNPSHAENGSTNVILAALSNAHIRLKNTSSIDQQTRAELLTVMAEAHLEYIDAKTCRDIAQEALQVIGAVDSTEEMVFARASLARVRCTYHMGRYEEAISEADKTLSALPKTDALGSFFSKFYHVRGISNLELGKPREAASDFNSAVAHCSTTKCEGELSSALSGLGNVQLALGEWHEARRNLERSVELARSKHGDTNQITYWRMGFLSQALADIGELDRAQELSENALEGARKIFGESTLGDAQFYSQLSHIKLLRGEYRIGLELAQKARELFRAEGDVAVIEISWTEHLIGRAKLGLNELNGAVEHCEASLSAFSSHTKGLWAGHALDCLAEGKFLLGDHASAITLAREALALRKNQLGPGSPWTRFSEIRLAAIATSRDPKFVSVTEGKALIQTVVDSFPVGSPYRVEATRLARMIETNISGSKI